MYVTNICNLGKGDLRVYCGEKDSMEDNQVMRDCIQREKKVAED